MGSFINFIEKWLKRLVLVQLLFLLIAQFLLQFDWMLPYLNRAAASEGVTYYLKPAVESVFTFFSGFTPDGL